MPQIVDSIRFSSMADQDHWPQIFSLGANQLKVEKSDLQFDAGRKLIFPGDAPLSVSGALVVLTGAPGSHRLTKLPSVQLGLVFA